jgi:hypothetical protein
MPGYCSAVQKMILLVLVGFIRLVHKSIHISQNTKHKTEIQASGYRPQQLIASIQKAECRMQKAVTHNEQFTTSNKLPLYFALGN